MAAVLSQTCPVFFCYGGVNPHLRPWRMWRSRRCHGDATPLVTLMSRTGHGDVTPHEMTATPQGHRVFIKAVQWVTLMLHRRSRTGHAKVTRNGSGNGSANGSWNGSINGFRFAEAVGIGMIKSRVVPLLSLLWLAGSCSMPSAAWQAPTARKILPQLTCNGRKKES